MKESLSLNTMFLHSRVFILWERDATQTPSFGSINIFPRLSSMTIGGRLRQAGPFHQILLTSKILRQFYLLFLAV